MCFKRCKPTKRRMGLAGRPISEYKGDSSASIPFQSISCASLYNGSFGFSISKRVGARNCICSFLGVVDFMAAFRENIYRVFHINLYVPGGFCRPFFHSNHGHHWLKPLFQDRLVRQFFHIKFSFFKYSSILDWINSVLFCRNSSNFASFHKVGSVGINWLSRISFPFGLFSISFKYSDGSESLML